jgi:hypothetical protein
MRGGHDANEEEAKKQAEAARQAALNQQKSQQSQQNNDKTAKQQEQRQKEQDPQAERDRVIVKEKSNPLDARSWMRNPLRNIKQALEGLDVNRLIEQDRKNREPFKKAEPTPGPADQQQQQQREDNQQGEGADQRVEQNDGQGQAKKPDALPKTPDDKPQPSPKTQAENQRDSVQDALGELEQRKNKAAAAGDKNAEAALHQQVQITKAQLTVNDLKARIEYDKSKGGANKESLNKQLAEAKEQLKQSQQGQLPGVWEMTKAYAGGAVEGARQAIDTDIAAVRGAGEAAATGIESLTVNSGSETLARFGGFTAENLRTVTGMVTGVAEAVAHPLDTMEGVTDRLGNVVARNQIMDNPGEFNTVTATRDALANMIGSATGVKQVAEAVAGVDINDARELSGMERVQRGAGGTAQVIGMMLPFLGGKPSGVYDTEAGVKGVSQGDNVIANKGPSLEVNPKRSGGSFAEGDNVAANKGPSVEFESKTPPSKPRVDESTPTGPAKDPAPTERPPNTEEPSPAAKNAPPESEPAKTSSSVEKELPQVNKAVNSDIQHAADRAVERGVFPDKKSAADALRALSKQITKDGLPDGTVIDPKRADSVLVPFGKGQAVYEITKKGTAVLRTVLPGT